jgi:hypothetical protein
VRAKGRIRRTLNAQLSTFNAQVDGGRHERRSEREGESEGGSEREEVAENEGVRERAEHSTLNFQRLTLKWTAGGRRAGVKMRMRGAERGSFTVSHGRYTAHP